MKGAGETISRLVMIVTVVLIFSAFVASQSSTNIRNQKIVLEETDLFRVKNTFFLANKSLAETWRLSTIQSAFYAGDVSVECGFDQKGKDLRIGEKYWLRTPVTSGKTNKVGARIAPEDSEKYNKEATPYICGPKRAHVDEVLNKKMADFVKSAGFKVNSLDVDVKNVRSVVNAEDEKVVSATSFDLEVSAGGCANSVSCVSTRTENVSSIGTELARMVDIGRDIIYSGLAPRLEAEALPLGNLLDYSFAFIQFLADPATQQEFENPTYIYALKYQDIFATATFGLPITNSRDDYIREQRGIISSIVLWRNVFKNIYLKNADISVSFSRHELIAPPQGAGAMIPGTGLLFHYDLTITMRDKDSYYFHNEAENKFEKRQIELQIKAEDYLPALDCTEKGIIEAIQIRNGNNNLQRIFNWEPSKRQLMCFQGLLYSCGDLKIDNFPPQNIIQPGNNMPDGFWKCTADGITT